jgi:hypothetical protein
MLRAGAACQRRSRRRSADAVRPALQPLPPPSARHACMWLPALQPAHVWQDAGGVGLVVELGPHAVRRGEDEAGGDQRGCGTAAAAAAGVGANGAAVWGSA